MKKRIIDIVGHGTVSTIIATYAYRTATGIHPIGAPMNEPLSIEGITPPMYIKQIEESLIDLNCTIIYEKEPSKYINKLKNNYKK